MSVRLGFGLLAMALCAAGCGADPQHDGSSPSTAPSEQAGPGQTGSAGSAPVDMVPAGSGPAGSAMTPAAGSSAQPSDPSKPSSEPTKPWAPTAPEGPDPTMPGAPGAYDYEMEQVSLDQDLVIAAGQTVRVGPGVTFMASSANVKVQVDGMLIAEGTAEAPVRFLGAGMPRSWHGIVIGSGGYAGLTHVEIGGATYGIHAMPGSDFAVDRAEIGTSFKAAVVQSDGSFDHTRFHASGDPTFSPVNEVSIDDVNGTLTVIDASPTVTNSSFDGSAALVDMIRVGGNASPVFDHLHIIDAHCAFHTNGGVNTMPRITNTVFERLAYGIMAYATKPVLEGNVFRDNGYDVGFCYDATAENTPMMSNNFYAAGEALIDPSCFQIGADEPSPATTANSAAGPIGL